MSILYIPIIVVNTTGTTSSLYQATFSFEDTTLGHLGELVNSTSVFIPGTSCSGVRCSVSKYNVSAATSYHMVVEGVASATDIVGSVIDGNGSIDGDGSATQKGNIQQYKHANNGPSVVSKNVHSYPPMQQPQPGT